VSLLVKKGVGLVSVETASVTRSKRKPARVIASRTASADAIRKEVRLEQRLERVQVDEQPCRDLLRQAAVRQFGEALLAGGEAATHRAPAPADPGRLGVRELRAARRRG
jgi:hypothetical protein